MKKFACSAVLATAALLTFGGGAPAEASNGPRTLISPVASFVPVSNVPQAFRFNSRRNHSMGSRSGRYLDGRQVGYGAYAGGTYVASQEKPGVKARSGYWGREHVVKSGKTFYMKIERSH